MREFTLRHKVKRHLGQSKDWIFWVSLVTHTCNVWRNELSAILSGIQRHFKFRWYVNCLINHVYYYLLLLYHFIHCIKEKHASFYDHLYILHTSLQYLEHLITVVLCFTWHFDLNINFSYSTYRLVNSILIHQP